ncbi:MAG: type II toxin-antitoxin system YoeB family toxin [Prevotellaceae bacterium]|nr:type II toxin-antitoxin system YoeB family toxin [Prevotellaceae bacterium]
MHRICNFLHFGCAGCKNPPPLHPTNINAEHRLVYSIREDTIEVYVFSMKYHYK